MSTGLQDSEIAARFEAVRRAGPLTNVAAAVADFSDCLDPDLELPIHAEAVEELERQLDQFQEPELYLAPGDLVVERHSAGDRSPGLVFALTKVWLLNELGPHVYDPTNDVVQIWCPTDGSEPLFREVSFRHDDGEHFAAAAAAGFITWSLPVGWSRYYAALYPVREAHRIARQMIEPNGASLPTNPREELIRRVRPSADLSPPSKGGRKILAHWTLRWGSATGGSQEQMGEMLYRLDVAASPEAGARKVRRLLREAPEEGYLPRRRGRPNNP